jgi:hypothetical protein
MAKNALTKVKSNGKQISTTTAQNFFRAYGDEAPVGGNIVGSLLIFSKGEWQRGQSKEEVEEGTRVIVEMNSLLVGWVRWKNQKPVEQRMGALAEDYHPEKRADLGYNDEKDWEPDSRGELRDPWVFSNQFLCKTEDGDVMTFSTSSRGGITAVQALCRAYAEECIEHEGEMPVVELGVDSYLHKDFGKTYVPIFPIVDWSDDLNFEVKVKPKAKTVATKKKPQGRASVR